VDPDVPDFAVADPDRLRQVLLNLVGNAVKFTTDGEVMVQLRQRPDAAGLSFAVSDTGPGIPADHHAHLFEAFRQADGSMQRQFGGTGLGLAISRRLTELMGGTIEVSSEVGRGTTFCFNIQAELVAGDRAAPSFSSGKYALIVESHPATRDLMEQHLAAWGLEYAVRKEVDSLVSALDAVNRRSERPVDVLVLG
jgi:hypothetical protein